MKQPTTADPYDILLGHNLWGTRQILSRCSRLSAEQFHRPFPIGPGARDGLHAILTHIVSAMRRWSDRIAARPVRASLEAPEAGQIDPTDPRDHRPRTPAELLTLLEGAHVELAGLAPRVRAEPAAIVGVAFGGTPYAFTASAAYIHVLTHGHYHRAQCMNILRRLEVSGISDTLPDLDVVDWQHETECAE